jgi:hypothetical protein
MISTNDYASPYADPFVKHCDGCDCILAGDLRPYRCSDGGQEWLLCRDCQREHSCAYCGDYSESLKTVEWSVPGTWETPPDNGSMVVCPACRETFERRR